MREREDVGGYGDPERGRWGGGERLWGLLRRSDLFL